jgi:hypothetical protein
MFQLISIYAAILNIAIGSRAIINLRFLRSAIAFYLIYTALFKSAIRRASGRIALTLDRFIMA